MYRADFETFAAACEWQDVIIADELQTAALNCGKNDDRTFTPTALYRAIAAAGAMIRNTDDCSLAEGFIDTDQLPERTTAAYALAQLLNASQHPGSATSETVAIDAPAAAKIDTCNLAECNWGEILHNLGETAMQPIEFMTAKSRPVGYQIIADGADPLLLRKGNGEPSALSLVPLSVTGIPYPAGSLFRLELSDDIQTLTGSGIFVANDTVTTHPVTDISRLSFQRLSAYAVPPKERQPFFNDLESPFWQSPEARTHAAQIVMGQVIDDVKTVHTALAA